VAAAGAWAALGEIADEDGRPVESRELMARAVGDFIEAGDFSNAMRSVLVLGGRVDFDEFAWSLPGGKDR
jgi:hypothetical protein